MHLVACAEPVGPLESAPETALLGRAERGPGCSALGFWGSDDRYYARLDDADGAVRWFTLGDTVSREVAPATVARAPGRRVTLVARATRAHGGALVWATRTRRRG